MKPVISRLPMKSFVSGEGELFTERLRYLGAAGLGSLLEQTTVRFAIANIGQSLCWIAESDSRVFWEAEIKTHIADEDEEGFSLDDFPGHYAYVASEWKSREGSPVVLLEVFH